MICLIVVWFRVISALHPFHVSVCDVEINSEAKAVQISQRIFLDDLELTLNNTFGTRLIIDDESTKVARDSLIELYLKDRLIVLIDGKKKTARYLGSEFEQDGIWCYIEIEGVKKVKQVEVTSTILYEEFDDQANIIHFKSGDYEKSVKLDEKNPQVTFEVPRN
jgi:uncharacterized protein involved in tellurium resistance